MLQDLKLRSGERQASWKAWASASSLPGFCGAPMTAYLPGSIMHVPPAECPLCSTVMLAHLNLCSPYPPMIQHSAPCCLPCPAIKLWESKAWVLLVLLFHFPNLAPESAQWWLNEWRRTDNYVNPRCSFTLKTCMTVLPLLDRVIFWGHVQVSLVMLSRVSNTIWLRVSCLHVCTETRSRGKTEATSWLQWNGLWKGLWMKQVNGHCSGQFSRRGVSEPAL